MNKKKLHKVKEKTEHFVDKIIPYLVVLLGLILVLEFTVDLHKYEIYIKYFDYVIVAFFLADLYFKWIKTKKIKTFVRLYWLDILAVFPFYLIFRTYLLFAELATSTEQAQKFMHEAVLLREAKVIEPFLKETEIAAKEASRLSRFERFIKTVQRFVRFLKGRWFIARSELLKRHIELKKNEKRKY